MIRYVFLLVLLTVYASCASITTEKPPDCGDNGVWLPCGNGCQLSCWMQKQPNHPVCRTICVPHELRGACGCKMGYEMNAFGKCDKC